MAENDTQSAYESQIASAAANVQFLRKQARQRFIGAAVLLSVAVIALPFVFDSKPRPVASTIAIEIKTPASEEKSPAPAATPPSAAPAPAPAATSPLATPITPPAPVTPAAQVTPTAPSTPPPAAAPAPKADDGARAAALLNGSGYQLQAGSFTDKAKLAEVQATLEKAGFSSFTQDAKAKDGTAHTRIRLGPYPTQAEANSVAARIGKLGIKTIVIKP